MARKKAKKKDKKAKKAEKKAEKKARKAAKMAENRAAQATPPTPVKTAAALKPAKKASAARPAQDAAGPKAAARRKKAKRANKAVAAPPALKARQRPESLRLRSAGPSFTVNDIHKSLAFYREVLGFTPGERWERDGALQGVELVAGNVTFWLGQDDWKKGRDRVKGQGFRMYCGTSQDVDSIAERIRAAGWKLAEEPADKPWGGRDLAVIDPDGFTITIASGL